MEKPIQSKSLTSGLRGQNIYLGDLQEQQLDNIYQWKNDFELGELVVAPPLPSSYEDVVAWRQSNQSDPNQVLFGVFHQETGRCIGIARLMLIDWISRTAQIGLYIGSQGDRGKSFGKEILSILVNYAFEKLNLRKLTLKVLEDNVAAVKCYQSCGFVQEGLLENHVWSSGKYKSLVLMSKFRLKLGENSDI